MTDFDWIINGIRPFRIVTVDDTAFPQITLHCAAHYTDSRYTAPIDEINVFKALASFDVTNKPNLSGGTVLEPSPDGQVIPISDGDDTYWGVLLFPQYTPDSMAKTLIKFDLILQLLRLNTPIVPEPPNGTIVKKYNKITDGFGDDVRVIGETRYLGTFTFNWDGTGRVLIASAADADPTNDLINVDDSLVVRNADGDQITVSYSTIVIPIPGPDTDMTSLLYEGDNEITFEILDVYGDRIGCGPLFMIQVA